MSSNRCLKVSAVQQVAENGQFESQALRISKIEIHEKLINNLSLFWSQFQDLDFTRVNLETIFGNRSGILPDWLINFNEILGFGGFMYTFAPVTKAYSLANFRVR